MPTGETPQFQGIVGFPEAIVSAGTRGCGGPPSKDNALRSAPSMTMKPPDLAAQEDEPDEEAEAAREKLAKGPVYMTPFGHQRLVTELEALGIERSKVVATVSDAAAEGDRSENAEYIYGKRRLRQIDGRMRFLRKIIEAAVLVDPAIDRGDKIYFGATVSLRYRSSATSLTYQLVGEHETDAETHKISFRSPLGAALLKKEAGDVVSVDTPSGKRTLEVVEVRYL